MSHVIVKIFLLDVFLIDFVKKTIIKFLFYC